MKRSALAALPLLLVVSCAGPQAQPQEDPPELLPNFHRWSDHLAQGGQPEGPVAFRRLHELGFRTVLSVDGALPDAEGARSEGLKTIHVPIGYDGVTREQAVMIVKAVQSSPEPVYVHCHHGKHRGPAAAALARIALEGVSNEAAIEDLRTTGCSPDYQGLYRDVAAFASPTAEEMEEVTDLPSQVPALGLRSQMVAVDGIWGRLKACRNAGWRSPPKHPDVTPAQEALMLRERFREIARLDEAAEAGATFKEHLSAAEAAAGALEDALRAAEQPSEPWERLQASCKTCHQEFRDG